MRLCRLRSFLIDPVPSRRHSIYQHSLRYQIAHTVKRDCCFAALLETPCICTKHQYQPLASHGPRILPFPSITNALVGPDIVRTWCQAPVRKLLPASLRTPAPPVCDCMSALPSLQNHIHHKSTIQPVTWFVAVTAPRPAACWSV